MAIFQGPLLRTTLLSAQLLSVFLEQHFQTLGQDFWMNFYSRLAICVKLSPLLMDGN